MANSTNRPEILDVSEDNTEVHIRKDELGRIWITVQNSTSASEVRVSWDSALLIALFLKRIASG